MNKPLIKVNNLRISFPSNGMMAEAVRGIDFFVESGEALGVLGESGSGKSISALSILGLIQSPGKITAGTIHFNDHNLLDLSERKMRALRGREISMVFQDPLSAFNPVYKIGKQILDIIYTHKNYSKVHAYIRALEVLELVGLPDPKRIMNAYPHELSGGMRQRALIGMALACEPKLLIADEPTTALDVTVQAQIVELFQELRAQLGLSLIYITHNLDLMAELCDRAIVMYAGRIVEESNIANLFSKPQHPYTRMLIDCVPRLDDSNNHNLTEIQGMPPPIGTLNKSCAFAPRCPLAFERCQKELPLFRIRGKNRVACWKSLS